MTEISKVAVSDFDAAVRLLSGGTNVAIYNDLGLPSIYVRKDKGTISDVISVLDKDDGTHPAFIVNGAEVPAFYMGKYLATVYKGRALSLPMQDPAAYVVPDAHRGAANSNNVDFDNAKIWCEANGAGFHLATLPEYAWVALKALANSTHPRGNNNYGADAACPLEIGVASYCDGDKVARTLTGSGPVVWTDNWKPDGICDLNGNVSEWRGGYRIVGGELQIFANNDAAMQYKQNSESTLWKAIMPDGSLVAPGTAGTLKWNLDSASSDNFSLHTEVVNATIGEDSFGRTTFGSLSLTGYVVPTILQALALMPDNASSIYQSDMVWIKNVGERFSHVGGSYKSGSGAGMFNANCTNTRLAFAADIGFRPAFIPGI